MTGCYVERERPSSRQLAWFFQSGLEPGVALPEQVRHVVTEHQAVGYAPQWAAEIGTARGRSSGLAVRKGCERVLVPPPPEWAVLLLVSDLVFCGCSAGAPWAGSANPS